MANDLIAAINVMRAKLDELEKMVENLPGEMPHTGMTSGYNPGVRFLDWCDFNGITKASKVRRELYHVAKRIDEGFTLQQLKEHREFRRKRTLLPLIDEFFAKWSSR